MEIKCTAGFSSPFFMFVCFFFSALNNTEELLIVGYVGFPHVCYRVGNQTNIRLFCFVVISFATALAEQIPMHRRRKVEWNFQLLIVCRKRKRRKLSLSLSLDTYHFFARMPILLRSTNPIYHILFQCLLLLVNGNSIKWKSSNDFHKVHRLLRKSSK